MTERLARLPPELRAYVEGLRERPVGGGWVQRLSGQAGLVGITSGDARFSEWEGRLTYTAQKPGLALSVSGGPLGFDAGDTLSLSGWAPVQASVEMSLGPRDSLRLSVQAPSMPPTLSSSEVGALAAVGTSVVDLSSIQFGTPTSVGVRYTHVRPLLPSALVSIEVGIDVEPRPGGSESAYWRGTTLLLGAGLADSGGLARFGVDIVVTRSFADSLGGRNLFFGGGTILARGHAAGLVGRQSDVLVGASVSYFHPYSTSDPGAAGRRLPLGDFAGASALVAWPIGGVHLMPAATLSRESSDEQLGPSSVTGSGWALTPSLSGRTPLSQSISVTLGAGHTTGSVRLDVRTAVGVTPLGEPITQRTGITDGLSGWWLTLEWSASL